MKLTENKKDKGHFSVLSSVIYGYALALRDILDVVTHGIHPTICLVSYT